MKVAIVTPTIGTESLDLCLDSVRKQTYKNICHYVFVDGKENFKKTRKIIDKYDTSNVFLDQNTGSDGWLGHRIYASCPYLLNCDVVCYLDEDNWLEPYHVKTMVKLIEKGFDWCYSLRKIYNKSGEYLFNDDCESLGKWPTYVSSNSYHIDTSCYMVSIEVAKMISSSWCKKFNADRYFFLAIKNNFPNFECTKEYSLCYRLGSTINSVQKEFFIKGNYLNKEKYGDKFPWSS